MVTVSVGLEKCLCPWPWPWEKSLGLGIGLGLEKFSCPWPWPWEKSLGLGLGLVNEVLDNKTANFTAYQYACYHYFQSKSASQPWHMSHVASRTCVRTDLQMCLLLFYIIKQLLANLPHTTIPGWSMPVLLTVLTASSEKLNFIFLTHVLMFELFMYVYSCYALSARFFVVDTALNSYFMIMVIGRQHRN